ncbi:MAG: hypothetical protein E7161_01025 [Firmicutes bacterium]|nr:hypothetical protein [Bacillota bacterium]
MHYKSKKKLRIILLILLITVSVCLFGCIFVKNTPNLDEKKLVEKNDSNMFAIMIGDLEGNYTKYKESILPQKEDGYIFNQNKSVCYNSDGEVINQEIQYRNNMVKMNVTHSSYCYLYFDVISKTDFCLDRGITNLKDCLLVMEDYSYNIEEAIEYIKNKGNATTSVIAPTITYAKKNEVLEDENGLVSTSDNFSLGTSYAFDPTTGSYRILNAKSPAVITDDYIDYYTCGGSWKYCTTMYQVKDYKVVEKSLYTTQYITKADVYTFKSVDSFDSEIGLYATKDEKGTS